MQTREQLTSGAINKAERESHSPGKKMAVKNLKWSWWCWWKDG